MIRERQHAGENVRRAPRGDEASQEGKDGYSRQEGTARAKTQAQCTATTEGLLAVILVVGTVRETGPCPSRMTHILGGGQGDIEKGKQGRPHLGLEGCFRVRVREKEEEILQVGGHFLSRHWAVG